MRHLLFGIAFLAVFALSVSGVSAQSAGDAENEFKAFREKLEAAKAAATAEDASPTQPAASAAPPADPLLDSAPVETDVSAAAADLRASAGAAQNPPRSPLGPAANLPLKGNMPPAVPGVAPQTPQELQAIIEAEAEMQRQKLEQMTFDAAVRQLLPLKPEQVREMLERFRESREAAETPITVPEPRQVVETISLDPGDAPTVVKTAPGHVTTVTVLDATGAPWPIQDISWAGKFSITPPEEGGHILRITPSSAHGVGNISIRLVDLITPITLRLQTGLEEVYYRFDARIPKGGPLAKTPLIEYGGLKTVAGRDDQMVGILDGTPPSGATRLKVEGVDGRTSAWRVDEKLYLRTSLTLLSPGWESSVSSADGMNVYSLGEAPVILLSDQGKMVRAHIVDDEVTP